MGYLVHTVFLKSLHWFQSLEVVVFPGKICVSVFKKREDQAALGTHVHMKKTAFCWVTAPAWLSGVRTLSQLPPAPVLS